MFFQGVSLLFFARGFVLFCDVLFSLLGVMFCFVFCEGFCFAMGFRFSVFLQVFFRLWFCCAKSFLLQVFFFLQRGLFFVFLPLVFLICSQVVLF